MLSDPEIRSALIKKVLSYGVPPRAVLEELHVHNGSAIADVVAVYNEAHCYEIKGDGDKVERIAEQGKYYDLAFSKITLVTTSRHISKALRIAPAHWGVMEAIERNEKVVLKIVRGVRKNPYFEKKTALLTLWKSELLDIASIAGCKIPNKSNRNMLSTIISDSFGKEQVSSSVSMQLAIRASTRLKACS